MLKSLAWIKKQNEPVISEKQYTEITNDFNLGKLFTLMSNEPKFKMTSDIFFKFITSDKENIQYRQCILKDFLKRKSITNSLEELIVLLDGMQKLHKILKSDLVVPKLILRLRKLESYYRINEKLEEIFSLDSHEGFSEEFSDISREIQKTNKENGMAELSADIKSIKKILSKIKSIDIGINLDYQYSAREAIILRINDFKYDKSNIIDKLLCVNKKDFNRMSVASEIDVRNSGTIMSFKNELDSEFETLLKNEIVEVENILNRHKDVITSGILEYRDEICLYYGALRLSDFLKNLKYNLCFPDIGTDINIKELFSVLMVYEGNSTAEEDKYKVVNNSIYLEPIEKTLIITGPNDGGKTILLESLGFIHLLFQNGIMIPAESAEIPIFKKIYSHFPKDEDLSLGTGRLGEEAVRVNRILNKADSNSLVLMNEPFITTSPTEGLDILVLSMKRFREKNVCIYLVTHYLDIFSELEKRENNASYVMEYNQGIKTYKALRRQPLTQSHALDVARFHGVDEEGIKELINHRINESLSEVQ